MPRRVLPSFRLVMTRHRQTTRSWSSDRASLSATTFLVSCYNITVNPEIEIRSYLKSFVRSFTKCVCFTGVISFHIRKRLKVTFFHLTSKQARLATGSCCISAHRQKSHCVPQSWKKNPQNKTGSHLKKQAVKDVFRKQRSVRWRCPLASSNPIPGCNVHNSHWLLAVQSSVKKIQGFDLFS